MKILNVTSNRNGISGKSFTKVNFTVVDVDGILTAIIDEDKNVFVLDPLNFEAEFRGDEIGNELLEKLKEEGK